MVNTRRSRIWFVEYVGWICGGMDILCIRVCRMDMWYRMQTQH